MKTKRLFSIVVCGLLLLGTGCFASTTPANEEEKEEGAMSFPIVTPQPASSILMSGDSAMPHFTAYSLYYEQFYQFVENPSSDVLNQAEIRERATVYSLSETRESVIRRESIEDPADFGEGTLFRIGNVIVDEPLVRFAGDTVELRAFLSQHGVIVGEIEYVAVLQAPAVPIVVWIQADGESYFIVAEVYFENIQAIIEEDLEGPLESRLVYRFYSRSAFYELIRQREGTLIVNGIDITDEAHIVFHHGFVELPFVAVLEALGADVQWIEDEMISITYAGKEYTLNIGEGSLPGFVEVETGQYHPLFVLGGGFMMFEVLDNELIITNWSMSGAMRALGVEMRVDEQRQVVTIG